jgi:DNA-3-methyladenine glycosylase
VPRDFYNRDPRRVSRELLGKVLIRHDSSGMRAGRIVELEAYLGAGDLAAHAAAGLTSRNQVLFGPPGHAYVYLIYGNHWCLNVSCMPEGEAGCVLIRALEPMAGLREMARARGVPFAACTVLEERPLVLRKLTSGPGRLCQALGITRPRDNGKDLTSAASDLLIVDDGFRPRRVATTTRIGITKDSLHPLRYVIAGNPFVSGKKV